MKNINKLLDKYLLDSCGKKHSKKKKIDEESSLVMKSSLVMTDSWWNRRANLIYVRNEEVLFSSTAEFPTGSSMTDEERRSAKARGFILLDW